MGEGGGGCVDSGLPLERSDLGLRVGSGMLGGRISRHRIYTSSTSGGGVLLYKP